MIRKKKWYYLIAFFILVDVGYSFLQHYHIALDGDLPNIMLPSERYEPLMDDPFALGVLLENKSYASPNRYFAHWFTAQYFRNVPLLLQNFVEPIDSVYLACAIIKTLIQFFIIILLAIFITGKRKWNDPNFLIAAALMTPLFHTTGYYQYMGVIDHATTYTLFYAFPLSLLLLFFLPFYQKLFFQKNLQFSFFQKGLLFLLTIFLSLNGPLNPPIVLLLGAMILGFQFWKSIVTENEFSVKNHFLFVKKKLGGQGLFFILIFCVFSLYSFYIGRSTTEGLDTLIPVSERYARLPEGIFNMLTQKVGFPILLFMIGLNIFFIKKQIRTKESEKILTFLKWVSGFVIIYILLLPLGGYREYRPNIVRRDTFLPITICIFYAYGITSFYLIKNILPKFKKWYVGGLILIAINFTVVDLPDFVNNDCERNALEEISKSKEDVIELENDCLIMTWIKVEYPEFTGTNSKVLQLWNITEKPILYFQK